MLQLATKSSGGMAASWNTVSPRLVPDCTSEVKLSFQIGLNVFCFVVVLCTCTSSTSIKTYGSMVLSTSFPARPTLCLRWKSVGFKSTASHNFTFKVPLNMSDESDAPQTDPSEENGGEGGKKSPANNDRQTRLPQLLSRQQKAANLLPGKKNA